MSRFFNDDGRLAQEGGFTNSHCITEESAALQEMGGKITNLVRDFMNKYEPVGSDIRAIGEWASMAAHEAVLEYIL